jgi:HlyD family secretion protein
MKRKILIGTPLVVLVCALIGWGGLEVYKVSTAVSVPPLPTTVVKRSDVRVDVTARGELQGGKSEMLIAPMTGGRDMAITFLRKPGELVNEGDVVVEFDTTEQAFALREAEADLAEAEQQVIQATAESQAKEEEARLSLVQAKSGAELAELDLRKNQLKGAITVRQFQLKLDAAGDKLHQLEADLASRKATTEAGVAIQEAARNKVKVKADVARRNIAAMTLRAKSSGYLAVQQNMGSSFIYTGMKFPAFQVGDTTRAGMAVAQIPDLKEWVVVARIGELDRGHMSAGQVAGIAVIALPNQKFRGKVATVGGTSGPPWNRVFECRISIDNPSPEMRPGMTAQVVITTEALPNALWVPSQALFERDGRAFVYLQSGSTFVPRDVTLVRRSESQAVLAGLREGQVVAMASPEQQARKKAGGASAARAIPQK